MTEDYVSLYLGSSFAKEGPTAFLSLALLAMGRIFPIITFAPFFGAKVLPHPVKVVLGISLFTIFLPQLTTSIKQPLDFNYMLLMYMVKELFIGFVMGFFISIPFNIVQSAGIIIDHQRGGASIMVNDPTIQNQSSPLGTLFNLILIYIFFLMNGPFLVIEIIGQSFTIIPPDQFFNEGFFNVNEPFWQEVIGLSGKVMILGTQLATPALLIILMTDVFLGIANRLAPQVQITFLGMPLKSLLGLTIVFIGWQLFTSELLAESYTWIRYLSNLVTYFHPVSSTS